VSRDRFLQADELPRFFQSLAEEPNIAMRDFILLALLTGARRENLCAMRWRRNQSGGFRLAHPRHEERHPAERDPIA
jgi:integrase